MLAASDLYEKARIATVGFEDAYIDAARRQDEQALQVAQTLADASADLLSEGVNAHEAWARAYPRAPSASTSVRFGGARAAVQLQFDGVMLERRVFMETLNATDPELLSFLQVRSGIGIGAATAAREQIGRVAQGSSDTMLIMSAKELYGMADTVKQMWESLLARLPRNP